MSIFDDLPIASVRPMLEDVRRMLGELPPGAVLSRKSLEGAVRTLEARIEAARPLDEFVSFRARCTAAHAIERWCRFSSRAEEPFTLRMGDSMPATIHVGDEYEIEAHVERDEIGRIFTGTLIAMAHVPACSPEETKRAWRAWFESVGGNEWTAEDPER